MQRRAINATVAGTCAATVIARTARATASWRARAAAEMAHPPGRPEAWAGASGRPAPPPPRRLLSPQNGPPTAGCRYRCNAGQGKILVESMRC